MKFVRTIWNLCSRISALSGMIDASWGRAVWYAVLLTFLCSFFAAGAAVYREHDHIRNSIMNLEASIQGLFIGQDAITLGNNEKEAHRVISLLDMPVRFDYVSDGIALNPSQWNANELQGVTAAPEAIFYWCKYGRLYGLMIVHNVDPGKNSHIEQGLAGKLFYTAEEFSQIVASAAPEKENSLAAGIADVVEQGIDEVVRADKTDAEKQLERAMSVSRFEDIIVLVQIWQFFTVFIEIFMTCIFQLLMAAFCFSLGQFLHLARTPGRMRYMTCAKLSLYAAFPPLIIAAFMEMIDIPYLDFQLSFLIVFFVYQMLAFREIWRRQNPQAEKKRPPGDDDF